MGGTRRGRARGCGAAGRRRQRHRGVAPGRVGDLRTLHHRRIPGNRSEIRRASWISAEPAPRPWSGGRPRRSNSASATRCCARCPPDTSRRHPRRSPGRWSTRCSSVRRATNTALRRRNSRSRTATSARTDPTVRWPSATRRSTATTSGRWPRSSSTSGSTPTTPKARSGRTSRSPSRTCWPARSSPTRCTCWRSSCPASGVPRSSSPTPTSPNGRATVRCGSRDSANTCRSRPRPTPRICCTPRSPRPPIPRSP